MENTGLQFFTGYTLVDITPTHVIRSHDPDDIKRNQQRNWETVLRCMSLRTQPLHISEPRVLNDIEISDNSIFGEFYEGTQKIWAWTWATENRGVYDLPNDNMGALLQDFEQVPIICGLEETARFILPIFYPYGSIKNIYFIERKNK
jgi:hypothetical protein